MELMGKYFNLPCLNVVHSGASFFFLVDIRLGKGGEDVREVAAEDVSGVEGLNFKSSKYIINNLPPDWTN